MNIRYVISAAAVLAFPLAGCAADPAPSTSVAPASSAAAPAPVPALAPQKVTLDDLPSWVDTIGARDAAKAGRPFLFPERDAGGGSSACHTYMRMPDGGIWILNRPDTAPVAGMAMSSRQELYGCGDRGFGSSTWEARRSEERVPTTAAPRPDGVPDLAWISTEVNLNEAQLAMKAGLPFMFASPSGGVAACHSAVLMPTGQVWVLNEIGAVPIGGAALSEMKKAYGCRASGLPNGEGN